MKTVGWLACSRHASAPFIMTPRYPPTLFARAIIAKIAESAMSVVWIPASASFLAIGCPSKRGQPSATTTWNSRFFDASLRKWKVVSLMPTVKITCEGAHACYGPRFCGHGALNDAQWPIGIATLYWPNDMSCPLEVRTPPLHGYAPRPGS